MNNNNRKKTKKTRIILYFISLFIIFCLAYNLLIAIQDYYERLNCEIPLIKSIDNNSDKISFIIEFNGKSNYQNIYIETENLAQRDKKLVLRYKKTKWFILDDNNKYLCAYGGINNLKWEFIKNNGERIIVDSSDKKINDAFDYSLKNQITDVVKIPEGAVKCRLIYYDNFKWDYKKIIKSILRLDSKELINYLKYNYFLSKQDIFINYGQFPIANSKADINKTKITSIEKGDKIIYDNKQWKLINKDETITLDLPACNIGSTIAVCGKGSCSIVYENKAEKKYKQGGIYGVGWQFASPNIVGTRLEDAENLRTNYMISNENACLYRNDFDYIYPWSEIKLCEIDNDGNIFYDVNIDCPEMNVMVEIPIFYVKRTYNDVEDAIYISEYQYEGFEVDPAFVTEKGIVNKIYVAAYLSSFSNEKVWSTSDSSPAINLSLEYIEGAINNKGKGWKNLNFRTLCAIQKLFLIETAVRNSQSIFIGPSNLAFIWSNEFDPKFAARTDNSTNTICIKKDEYNEIFEVNDRIAIVTEIESNLDAWKCFTDNYDNESEKWNRVITGIEKDENLIHISFSGPPVDVDENISIITHLPIENGLTDNIISASGQQDGLIGKNAFKYRNIENLWGNVCVILDDVYMENNGQVFIDDELVEIELPIQEKAASLVMSMECGISRMGYNEGYELLFFPAEIEKGKSSLTNYFGDWFCAPVDEERRYLTYGMTWDLQNYAGLFSYRFDPSYDTHRCELGSRLIYVP